jgi:hypothetical protein
MLHQSSYVYSKIQNTEIKEVIIVPYQKKKKKNTWSVIKRE